MGHLLSRMRLTQPSIPFLIPKAHACVLDHLVKGNQGYRQA